MWIDELAVQNCHIPLHALVWVPKTVCVVLGNANQGERECHLSHCQADAVPIWKRAGGGGAVVLHSGCVVLTLGLWVNHYYRNSEFFHAINTALIRTLQKKFPDLRSLAQDGFSDITLNGRKIVGTSLFRSRNYLLYQASILVDSRLSLIERYLAHPSREPVYRQGKSHRDFLSSLAEASPHCPIEDVRASIETEIALALHKELREELCEPHPSQIDYLRKRFGLA